MDNDDRDSDYCDSDRGWGLEEKKEGKRKERGSYFSFLLYCEMNISPSIDATGRAIDGNSGI